MNFKELGLKAEIVEAITELGFESPMPVQAEVIPFMHNESKDLVALAQTGTGKTAAFGLPILNLIETDVKRIEALILAPTRELCIQISKDMKNFSKYLKGFKVVPVYGGENILTQLRQLDTPPQVLVATPGRLIDLMRRKKVDLGMLKFLVLDEADEMLNMGFQEDLETILSETPSERRTMLFSATMPQDIVRISKKYMKEYGEITVGTRNSGNVNVEHHYYMTMAKNRYLALKRIVDIYPDIYGIVFCRTRQETKDIAEKLMHDGYNADALHGDLSQAQRDAVMNKFRIHNLQILVATDVAARGLDVSDLTHVINYNLPDDIEIYIHRSGRTGRAGKSGISISIIHSRERNRLKDVERSIKTSFIKKDVPNGEEICKRQLFNLIDKMEKVEVNNDQIEPFLPEILAKLIYLEKDDIIKRFVSLEFNRFLEYYKNAVDLNVDEKAGRRGDDRGDRGDRGERGRGDERREGRGRVDGRRERSERDRESFRRGEDNGGSERGQRVRFRVNIGAKHSASARSILTLINETTNDKRISVGDIEIDSKFSYFDIFADQSDKVLQAFQKSSPDGIEVQKMGVADTSKPFRSDRQGGGGDRRRSSYDKGRPNDKKRGGGDKPWRRKY